LFQLDKREMISGCRWPDFCRRTS